MAPDGPGIDRYDVAVDELEAAQQTGDSARLDRAVQLLRKAVAEAPDEPGRSVSRSMLGVALHTRFTWRGRSADIDEAVAIGTQALAASSQTPERVVALANLANTLRIRFEAGDDLADLRTAIDLGRDAAQLARDHAQRVVIASNLGLCLRLYATRTGEPADLDAAVAAGRTAVELLPREFPLRGAVLANAAAAHQVRFDRTADGADLDEAIALGRAAVDALSPDRPEVASVLSNLGTALQSRGERSGRVADTDESIRVIRAALATTPKDRHDRLPRLTNLAAAYLTRFDQVGELADLDAAVTSATQAVEATPAEDPALPGRLSNLAAALRLRFEETDSMSDVDGAIAAASRAAAGTPPGSPARPGYLSALGVAYRARFGRTRAEMDVEAAIVALVGATDAIVADHPDRASLLSNLGAVWYEWYAAYGSADRLERSVDAFRAASAVISARPSVRVATSTSWGRVAAEHLQWAEAVEALSLAVDLLATLARRDIDRADQERQLARHGAVASDAAACALELGDVDRALVLLEQGRGLLLGQTIETQSDLTALRERHPELADQFDRLRLDLERPAPAGGLAETQWRSRTWSAFEAALTGIRERPSFGDFLRPPSLSDLIQLAEPGPVIIVNISKLRSDAMIVTSTGVRSVPLPAATPETVHAWTAQLVELNDQESGTASSTDDNLTRVLAWTWEAIVEPVMVALDAFRAEPLPVWWVPTGLATLLPLHAAQSADRRHCALDHLVSSYTPTLRTLEFARRPCEPARRILVVAPSPSPTEPGLPAADREASAVEGWVDVPVDVHSGYQSSRSTVLHALPRYTWVHFACHARTDPVSPSRSALMITDPDGTPLDVRDLSCLRLRHGELAYLSACSTTRTAVALSDEAIHITSACLLAGFSHVVGTLWPVSDSIAMRLAREVYQRVTTADGVRADRAAAAVREAAISARRRWPEHPTTWAGIIHAGG